MSETSTVLDIIVAVIAILGFLLALRVYYRDKNLGEETSDLQRRMVTIEEARHGWELEERTAKEEARALEEVAELRVSFAYRQSSQRTGRVMARNQGKAVATDVLLEVSAEQDGERRVASSQGRKKPHEAQRLRKGESVFMDIEFGPDAPEPSELRYRLIWTDGRGPQERDGPVPIDDE